MVERPDQEEDLITSPSLTRPTILYRFLSPINKKTNKAVELTHEKNACQSFKTFKLFSSRVL